MRKSLRKLGVVLASGYHHVHGLKTESRLARRVEDLNNAIESLNPQRTSSGNFDFVARDLRHSFDDGAKVAASLIAPSGVFVDSSDALGVLQVRSDYSIRIGSQDPALLGNTLAVGYRPQTEIIRELPTSTFRHPGYEAPLEDLLDFFGVDFYAARRAGDAEDGAVGWLLRKVLDGERIEDGEIFLRRLSEDLEHWTIQRLVECLQTWDRTVGPALGAVQPR